MSSEISSTGEPSRCSNGEGCQDRAGQSRKDIGPKPLHPDHRVGGVGGGGGPERVVGLSGETCDGGASPAAPTSGTNAAKPHEADRAVAGVGDLHSSVDPADRTTAGERREGTCPPASQSGEGPDDGWSDELWIKTSPKVRKLQRVLYRKAKAEPLNSAEINPNERGLGKPCAGKPPARFDEGESCIVGRNVLHCRSLYSTQNRNRRGLRGIGTIVAHGECIQQSAHWSRDAPVADFASDATRASRPQCLTMRTSIPTCWSLRPERI